MTLLQDCATQKLAAKIKNVAIITITESKTALATTPWDIRVVPIRRFAMSRRMVWTAQMEFADLSAAKTEPVPITMGHMIISRSVP